jgi:hypothetical protein
MGDRSIKREREREREREKERERRRKREIPRSLDRGVEPKMDLPTSVTPQGLSVSPLALYRVH